MDALFAPFTSVQAVSTEQAPVNNEDPSKTGRPWGGACVVA
ncbi:uncharacterized protein PFL1_06826 [Pseudozyma flocculosa PF-1]|uniref:Uncharacterized protein n=1 Tax=Pseudozyma flocculosa TaxID=84751 RepID=A0A5C3EYS8_9BASI|nr:uncharacterized protein PFL1_06826 [Pseudozyma flocculosa PF-1]EPQ30810.1 hypothetical protein PFL1_06826 [Pseudozyma flocculosa PF-1]SPO36826.1 uncharacterized protein PSFLO_02297 [Pseudozyma flocculosa]